MPIELKCSNAGCTTVMAVKEEHAGRSVKCPSCGTVTVVPSPSAAAPQAAVATAGTPLPSEVPGGAPAGASPMETIRALCKANNLDDISGYALAGGMAAYVLLVLSTILPPYTFIGALIFVLSVGVGVFVLVSFAKMHVFFDKSLFAGAAWGAFVFIVLILMMIASSEVGIGSYIGLLASMGIMGAFGFLSYLRLVKK